MHVIGKYPVMWLLAGLLAGLLIGHGPTAQGQETAWHMIVVSPQMDMSIVQNWMTRRGIAAQTVGTLLAAQLSEADVEALGERDFVLEIRAPLPGEYIPKPPSIWQWLPIVQAKGGAP